MTGGKNKKNKRNKTRKQMKGGGMMDYFLNGTQTNVSTGIGAKMLYELQTIGHIKNASVSDQPAGNLNNEHSPLLA